MRFMHLSDLHLGKRLNEMPLIDDQRHILDEIVKIADDKKPDAVIIAGDVYDKTVPSEDAVELFDVFLCHLAKRGIKVFVISGNHDSSERVAFGGKLMNPSGVYMAPVYAGRIDKITLTDSCGPVNVYMLPFVKPANVRSVCSDECKDQVKSYTDAVRTAISMMDVDYNERNILVCHQFVTGAARSDSEEITVGGLDNVNADVFDGFDYVALGHIHKKQNVGGKTTVRYCGTPLKYSASEADDDKTVTIVDCCEKGKVVVDEVPLCPKRDLCLVKGTYNKVTDMSDPANRKKQNDYVYVTLSDEDEIPDVYARLRAVYPHMMEVRYDNTRTRAGGYDGTAAAVEKKTPLELFGELYEQQNGEKMSTEQSEFVAELINEIWEKDK